MTLKLTKDRIIEFNFTGAPDNTLWHRGWKVSLGKQLWGFYYLIWQINK